MKKKSIILRLNKKTNVISVHPQGYSGKECLEATKSIEEFLGMVPTSRKLTADFYKKEESSNQKNKTLNPH